MRYMPPGGEGEREGRREGGRKRERGRERERELNEVQVHVAIVGILCKYEREREPTKILNVYTCTPYTCMYIRIYVHVYIICTCTCMYSTLLYSVSIIQLELPRQNPELRAVTLT